MQLDVKNSFFRTEYNISFANLTDLYNYIKSNPAINAEVFKTRASLNPVDDFHGERLSDCIEWCFGGYEKGLDNFLVNSLKLKESIVDVSDSRRYVRSLYGGVPIPPLVAANVPDSMARYDIDKSLVTRNIYFSLSYDCTTTYNQIVNRGLATLFIIQALEEKRQIIDLKAEELVRVYDEYVRIDVGLKKPGDLCLDISKCYFPMVSREFLRRLLFRVLESVPVKNHEWDYSYGKIIPYEELREILELKEDDLLIGGPRQMGIKGDDVYDDTISMIKKLGLEAEFDLDKIQSFKEKGYQYVR